MLIVPQRDARPSATGIGELAGAERHLDQLELVAESLRRAALHLERLLGRVDAELVRAPGDGRECDVRDPALTPEHAEARDRGLAVHGVVHLARPVVDVGADRKVDDAFALDAATGRRLWSAALEDVLYVRYARCTWDLGLRAFTHDVLARLDADPGLRLVVDLRGNTGGTSLP